jgi:ligand-binding SRPBCC domain-containing protein
VPTIRLQTYIEAPVERCFDLARSIDAHMGSTSRTKERAIAGVTSGLINLGETVTWEAVHFGVKQHLTSQITRMDRPNLFVDEMVRGIFHSISHLHEFKQVPGGTLMLDTFRYTSPLGSLGRIADRLFLERYLRSLLRERNRYLKRAAESKLP